MNAHSLYDLSRGVFYSFDLMFHLHAPRRDHRCDSVFRGRDLLSACAATGRAGAIVACVSGYGPLLGLHGRGSLARVLAAAGAWSVELPFFAIFFARDFGFRPGDASAAAVGPEETGGD